MGLQRASPLTVVTLIGWASPLTVTLIGWASPPVVLRGGLPDSQPCSPSTWRSQILPGVVLHETKARKEKKRRTAMTRRRRRRRRKKRRATNYELDDGTTMGRRWDEYAPPQLRHIGGQWQTTSESHRANNLYWYSSTAVRSRCACVWLEPAQSCPVDRRSQQACRGAALTARWPRGGSARCR